MKYWLLCLCATLSCIAMERERLQVVLSWAIMRATNRTTFFGLLDNGRTVAIEVCTKERKTRNANPLELHYSGRIGKKRLTGAQATRVVRDLQEAYFLNGIEFSEFI